MSGYAYGQQVYLLRPWATDPEVIDGAGWDPAALTLYLPPGAASRFGELLPGDIVGLSTGGNYRVTKRSEVWVNPLTGWEAGIVTAGLEPADALESLPDLAQLERPGPPVFDREANTEVPGWVDLGTWRVLVEPPAIGAAWTETEQGGQRLAVQPYMITAPLGLVDVQPGDRLTVLQSGDPRLVGRALEVARVHAGSLASRRQLVAVENQG